MRAAFALPAASLRRLLLVAVLSVLGLAGCASTWTVDNDVRTFTKGPAIPAGAAYRFERLPSQQADEAQQRQLEDMAAAALQRVGLQHDEARAAYSVQVGARVLATVSPWIDPWRYPPGWGPDYRFGYGLGYGRRWYGAGWYGPVFPDAGNPWYEREVSLVLRALPGAQVVYETGARNDGPYHDSHVILPRMFEAALQGFPNPPQGERRVDIVVEPARAAP